MTPPRFVRVDEVFLQEFFASSLLLNGGMFSIKQTNPELSFWFLYGCQVVTDDKSIGVFANRQSALVTLWIIAKINSPFAIIQQQHCCCRRLVLPIPLIAHNAITLQNHFCEFYSKEIIQIASHLEKQNWVHLISTY